MLFARYKELFFESFSNYWSYLVKEVTTPSWDNYFYWLIGISLFFFILEVVRPWYQRKSIVWRDFWLDSFYMFFNFFIFSLIGYNAVSSVVVEAFNDLLGRFGIQNLVAISIEAWPVWAQLILMFVLRDLIQWNVHRWLHQVPILWEFHKVHHSAKELGFATHLRFHWMETVLYRSIEYIPLAMIGFGIREFFFVHLIALAIGHFNHSNIYVPLGPLKYVFNNPQFHKWHHVQDIPERKKYGINFALSLSLWDYLFGTAEVPYEGRDIRLGYPEDQEMPKGFWGQILFPLTKRSAPAKDEEDAPEADQKRSPSSSSF